LGYAFSNYDAAAAANNDWTRDGSAFGGGNFIYMPWLSPSTHWHEAGHEIGLGHARAIYSVDGATDEYGNTLDTMGDGESDYGLRQKIGLGWIGWESVVTNPVQGNYRIDGYDQGYILQDSYYGLYFNSSPSDWIFEYRSAIASVAKSLLPIRISGNAIHKYNIIK